jgi:hypothetical protein
LVPVLSLGSRIVVTVNQDDPHHEGVVGGDDVALDQDDRRDDWRGGVGSNDTLAATGRGLR